MISNFIPQPDGITRRLKMQDRKVIWYRSLVMLTTTTNTQMNKFNQIMYGSDNMFLVLAY